MPRGLTEQELDEQFELFLQEPVSDESLDWSSSETQPGSRGAPRTAQRPAAASWCEEDERSHPDECRVEETHRKPLLEAPAGLWSFGPLDSLTPETLTPASDHRRSACSPAASVSAQPGGDSRGPAEDAVGLDTLEEEEEKSKFFAKLQAEVSSPVDYSKLMGALDSTGSSAGKTLGKSEEAAEPRGNDEGIRTSPRERPGSPQYSDHFEEEEEEEEQACEEPGSLAEGQVNLHAAAVEMEAVREAYRQIQEHSEGDYQPLPGAEGGGASSRAQASPAPSQRLGQSLGPTSTAESDLPTAAELLRPVCPEEEPTHAASPSAAGTEDTLQTDALVKLGTAGGSPPTSALLEGTFYVEARQSHRPRCLKASRRSAEPPVHPQSCSLRQEVDRLMQDHNPGSSHLWPLHPKAAKRPCRSSTSSSNKPPVASSRGSRSRVAAGASRPAAPRRQRAEEEDEGAAEVLQQQRGSSSWTRPSASQQDWLEQQLPDNREQRRSPRVEEPRLQPPPKDAQRKEGGEEHIHLLQSKLWSSEEAKQKVSVRLTDSAAEEKFQQMQKEINEQERLLKGYQQENEKLYLELKAEKSRSRALQDAMFQEQKRSRSRALQDAMSQEHQREQLSRVSTSAGGSCSGDGSEHTPEHMSVLLAEMGRLQRKEKQLREDVHRLEQENQALLAEGSRRGAEASAPQQQRLEATDAARLKAASADIKQLKAQVEQMKLAVSTRSSELQQRGRQEGAGAQRVEQQQPQVRELQRSREVRPASAVSSRTHDLLELKVQRLEAELEKRNQEAKGSFQAMELRFQSVQARYEQHACELQQQLDGARAQRQSLEEEQQRLKAAHQERERALHDETAALQQQLKHKERSGPGPGPGQQQPEGAFGVRIQRLNRELSAKTRTIQELSRSVEQLQKDKRRAPPTSSRQFRAEHHRTETRQPPGGATPPAEETFPAAGCQKTYRPAIFTDSHISDVLQENEALKHRLELLELQAEQEKEMLKVEVAQAREQLLRMQQQHQASSQLAEWSSKVQTQQITVEVLQEQLQELEAAKDGLEVSRRREEALQQQLSRLLVELKEARDAQSPELKLLCSLERKLVNMELRHQSREQELQQVIGRSWQRSESEERSQVECWRRVAEDKSRQLEAFRQELDSILDLVRCLQREGVLLPVPAASTGPLLAAGLLKELR